MTDKNQTEATVPDGSDEAQKDVAKATDTKAEATGTAKASDELSEDDLKAVSGGRFRGNLGNFARPGYRK